MQPDSSTLWHLLSGLGNLAVTTSLMLIIAVWLLTTHVWKTALIWCALYGTAMIIVLITKIAFIGWGIGIESLDFTGISGHATRASVVLPVLFYLAMQTIGRPSFGALIGIVISGLVAVSRVMVGAHSISEAAAGYVFGCCIGLLFSGFLRNAVLPKSRWWLTSCLVVLLFISPMDKSIDTDPLVNRLALIISNHKIPVTRKIWGRLSGQAYFLNAVTAYGAILVILPLSPDQQFLAVSRFFELPV